MTKIDQLKQIVSDFSMGEVEGVEVDVQTANAIVTVYNALGSENKERFINSPIEKMASISWQLVTR
jgi:ribosomal protein L20A (L18A)